MRTLIFSDTHLTDQFDEKKYNFLKKIISSVDQVIINGDFWDGYEISFSQFIHSKWQNLFPLLKEKKTIYLYGNHDQKRFSDKRVKLFSNKQAYQYKLKTNKMDYIIEHGNKIYPFYDETTDIHMSFFIKIFFYSLHVLLIRTTGNFFFKTFFGKSLNKEIERRFAQKYKNKEILVCGHTHSPEFNIQKRFINLGFILYGLAHYLIIENDTPFYKEEWYA